MRKSVIAIIIIVLVVLYMSVFDLAYRDIRGIYCHDYSIPARSGHEKTALRRPEFLNVLRM